MSEEIKMQGSDYYFQLVDDEETQEEFCGSVFYITERSYFDANNHLDAGGKGRDALFKNNIMPSGFAETMEAIWSYNGCEQEGKGKLIAAGFVEKEMLSEPLMY